MSTLTVLRYSALAAGVVYGAYHSSTLYSQAQKSHEDKVYAKKEALILEAKQKFAELNKKPEPIATPVASSTTEINFDDEKLDIAQAILSAVENLKE